MTEKELQEEGYFNIEKIEGRGLCGLFRFIYTTGLCYGLNEYGYEGRYCFESTADAEASLKEWDGNGDPSGDWIKHKGEKGEYSNPNNII